VTLEYGAMAPLLSKQVEGIPDRFQRHADAITRLAVNEILTAEEANRARVRLSKSIEREMRDRQKFSSPRDRVR
jgi:hypothetical protein